MSDGPTKLTEPPPRLSEAELAQLAVDMVEGRVYLTNTEQGIRHSFALLVGLTDMSAIADKVGAIYEDVSKAGPRGINGFPFFFSGKLLHVDDFDPLLAKANEYEQQRKAFVGEDP